MKISHDGSNSKIHHGGSGGLKITTADFQVQNGDGSEWIMRGQADGAVELYYDNSKRIETDANGTKLIGNGSAAELEIRHDASTYTGSIYSNNLGVGLLDSSGNWAIQHASGTATTFSISNASEIGKFTIATRGGNIATITDADGIKFNGDTAAANALDDYETGSFTPALSGFSSISYHRQKGQYTKIGRQVWMHIYFYVYQATGDSNVVTITGLPFTSSNADSGHIQNGGHIWYQNDTFKNSFESNGRPYVYIGSNSSYAQFRNQGGGDLTGENTYLGSGANNRYIICGLQMIV